MNVFLQIACRTIKRRLDAGQTFGDVIKEYPRLTEEQIIEIREELSLST